MFTPSRTTSCPRIGPDPIYTQMHIVEPNAPTSIFPKKNLMSINKYAWLINGAMSTL